MKNALKKSKRMLAMLLSMTLLITSVPSSALTIFANDGEETKHDNPWDYTIFTESGELDLEIFGGTGSSISGDIHSNNDIIGRGRWIDIDGILEASGEVDLNTQDSNPSEEPEDDPYREKKSEGVKQIPLANIYYAIMANEGGKARSEIAEDTSPEDMLRTSIIKDGDLTIDLTEEAYNSLNYYSRKAGVFSAGFLTKIYENPDKWASVLPIFESDFEATEDSNGKIDLVELVDNSYFAATNEQTVDGNKYSNAEKLPTSSFMDHLNDGYVSGYVDEILESVSEPTDFSDYHTLTSGGINPADAQGKSKLYIPNHMNVTLQGDYNDLEELYLYSSSGIQLLGNFPKLKHIYALNESPNLNLAGNFNSLQGVYKNHGSLLLGTADLGFTAHNADIINTYETITLYTAKDTDISGCQILNKTNGIAVRGGGTSSPAKFIADGAMIASNYTISMVDINDTNTAYFKEIPTIFAQSSMSIVNCNFEFMQGAFVTRNDVIKFADSNADVFRGFLFSQNGLSEYDFSGNYINCETYNYLVNPNINAPGVNLYGTALGHIGEIEYACLPEKFTNIPGTEDFLAEALQIKNSDGEYTDRYESGLRTDEEPVIYIMATGDITITAEDFVGPKGRRMIIASRNGDITFEADPTTMPDGGFRKTEIDALFYAPNGAVNISSSGGLTLKGRIYADSADISGYWVDVIPQDDDLDILNVREQFKLDDINYEYNQALNAYYLTNTNLNDTIISSLHTTENVEEITYAVQKLNYFTDGWHDAYIDGTLNANDRYFTINNAALRINEIKRVKSLNLAVNSSQAITTVVNFNRYTKIYNINIDRIKLKIATNAYNNYVDEYNDDYRVEEKLEKITVEEVYYSLLNEPSNKFLEYTETYNFTLFNEYFNQLSEVLFEYCKNHPNVPFSSIYDLTFEQIDLLDSVVHGDKELDEIDLGE